MEHTIVKPMLRSLLISYLLSGVLLAALAFALFRLRLKEGQVSLMIWGIYLIACLCGGMVAGKGIRKRRFFWGLLAGALYFCVLFAMSWLIGGDAAFDLSHALTVLGICAVGGTLGGMIS